jgi:hypothetical protein
MTANRVCCSRRWRLIVSQSIGRFRYSSSNRSNSAEHLLLLRRHFAQGLGRQPDLGAGAVGADVGVVDVPPTGPLGGGSRQPDVAMVRQPVATSTCATAGALNKYLLAQSYFRPLG